MTTDKLITIIADEEMGASIRLSATKELEKRLDLDDVHTLKEIESYHGWSAANWVAAYYFTRQEPLPF